MTLLLTNQSHFYLLTHIKTLLITSFLPTNPHKDSIDNTTLPIPKILPIPYKQSHPTSGTNPQNVLDVSNLAIIPMSALREEPPI